MRPGSALAAALALTRRDLLLAWRRRGDTLNPLLFAAIVAVLFPLALGPEAQLLARVAGGIAFVILLLAMLLTLDALFRGDAEDGSLDHLLASGQPLALLAAGKLLAQILTVALPLCVVTPLLAAMLGLPRHAWGTLAAALLLAAPLLACIGACCAALTVGMRRSGILLALLVLPLTVPVLIFGAGAVEAALTGVSPQAPLLFLAAGLVAALPLAPAVCAAAWRLSAS